MGASPRWFCFVGAALTRCALEHPFSHFPDGAADAGTFVDERAVDAQAVDISSFLDVPRAPDAGAFDAAVTDDVVDAAAQLDVGEDLAAESDVVDAGTSEDVLDLDAPGDVADSFDVPDARGDVQSDDVPRDVVADDAPADVVDSGPPIFDSCEAARVAGRPSGPQWIRAGSSSPWRAYCDTTEASGAWTLVLKASGQARTFVYSSPLWTNTALHNAGSANLDRVEAKFIGFVTLPVRALRVQLVTPPSGAMNTARSLVLTGLSGAPLQRVFLDGAFIDLGASASEGAWLGLVPNSNLQDRCRRRGFNARASNAGSARVRIGMIGNENGGRGECDSHDSWVGVGSENTSCGGSDATTVGNVACYAGRDGDRNIPAFAYLWVR